MDSKLILIKLITLLYCQSICAKIKTRSTDLCTDVLDKLHLPKHVSETDIGRNAIISLRETIYWMLSIPSDEKLNFRTLLQRLELTLDEDPTNALEVFRKVGDYDQEEDNDKIWEDCLALEREIKHFMHQMSIRELVNKAHRNIFYNNGSTDYKQLVNDLILDLETHSSGWTESTEAHVLNLMDIDDPKSIQSVLERAKEETSGVSGGFQTGYQSINRMFGESGQLNRGMFVLIGALTHNYKSGLAHDIFRHMCIYNEPMDVKEGHIPTLLYFSVENSIEDDILRMYTALRENETGIPVKMTEINVAEASQYVSQRLRERGWYVQMMRIDPTNFTYQDLFDIVLKYESKGHDIHGIVFDYLNLVNKSNLRHAMTGEDTRQLMQRVRTFMAARNILFITPHQLSQEAMNLKRAGVQSFVSEIASKNYWDGSKRIANEVDLEIFVDIVTRDNRAYLEVHRGKHRTVRPCKPADKHFYIPFASDDRYGLIDDVNGEDLSLDNIMRGALGADIDFD